MSRKKKNKKKDLKTKIPAVVFDYDDTIVSFSTFVFRYHNWKHGTCAHPSDMKKWNFEDLTMKDMAGNVVTGEDIRNTFQQLEHIGLYASLPVIKVAREAIDQLRIMGYKIIIVTARKLKFREETELNAFHQKVKYDELIFSNDKVATIKKLSKKYHIEAFADDRGLTVKNVAEQTSIPKVFLIDQSHNKDTSGENIIRINDLSESIRHISPLSK